MSSILKPFWVVLDGLDRCGKSQQHLLLADWVEQLIRGTGRSLHLVRDPGSTELGEEIRNILKYGKAGRCTVAETLLFMASRAQMLHERIHPLYRQPAGQLILSDRYDLSTMAYQGHGRPDGLPLAELRRTLQNLSLDPETLVPRVPDLYIVLDIDYQTAKERTTSELMTCRLEEVGQDEWMRRRQGFLFEVQDPTGLAHSSGVIVDGRQGLTEAHKQIVSEFSKRWP